jgi:hypothetical protein
MGLFDFLGLNGTPQTGPGGWSTQTQFTPGAALDYNLQNDSATKQWANNTFGLLKQAMAPKSAMQLAQSPAPQAQPVGAIQVNNGKPLVDPQTGAMNQTGAFRPLGY